jgi:uncharacterized alpha-E superfamily protein
MTSGEKSQDVWIVSDRPVAAISLLSVTSDHTNLKRGGAELPSRAADNLFWLGRNLERAEQLARLVRISLQQLTSEESGETAASALALACQHAKQLPSEPGPQANQTTIAQQLTAGILDPESSTSLRSVVRAAHGTAMKVRDRVALDSLRVLNDLRDTFELVESTRTTTTAEAITILDAAITALSAISGLASESMTRTQGWRFLDMGRRIERAFQTTRVIRSLIPASAVEVDSNRNLEYLLQICDSFMTYRNRYLAHMQLAAVLDLLIVDDTNPRSLVYQLQAIHLHVEQLPRPEAQASMTPEQRIALSQYNTVRLCDVYELAAPDNRGELAALHKLLTRLMEQLPKLADTISGRFLIHAGLQRHLASAAKSDDVSYGTETR